MINLPEVTFIIPCRKDSKDREANINILLDYINYHLNVNIMLWEIDTSQKMRYLKDKCNYRYVQAGTFYFHKAEYINQMVRNVKTPVINIQDTDVLLKPYQWVTAVKLIIEQDYKMILPHNMCCYTIKKEYHSLIRELPTAYRGGGFLLPLMISTAKT